MISALSTLHLTEVTRLPLDVQFSWEESPEYSRVVERTTKYKLYVAELQVQAFPREKSAFFLEIYFIHVNT